MGFQLLYIIFSMSMGLTKAIQSQKVLDGFGANTINFNEIIQIIHERYSYQGVSRHNLFTAEWHNFTHTYIGMASSSLHRAVTCIFELTLLFIRELTKPLQNLWVDALELEVSWEVEPSPMQLITSHGEHHGRLKSYNSRDRSRLWF